MEIRSYRRVFDVERRLYRVDQLRLNPAGVPLRGVVYMLGLLLLVVLAARLPVAGRWVRTVPWFMSYLALPVGAATVLGAARIDGRPFHLAARSALRRSRTRGVREGLASSPSPPRRWHPPDILFLPDGSDHDVRALRYVGPGAVLIALEHQRRVVHRRSAGRWAALSRPNFTIEVSADAATLPRGCVIELARGVTMETLPPTGSNGA